MRSGDNSIRNVTVPVTHQIQKITVAAHTLPFTDDSKFTLSFGNFFRTYRIYVGQSESDHTCLDIGDNGTYIKLSEKDIPGIYQSSLLQNPIPG